MKKSAIGHVICPVCGHNDAEVKEDKNGHAFIFCPDCAAQTFTRNDYRNNHLRKRMRPVTVTDTEQIPAEQQAQAVPDTKPEPIQIPKQEKTIIVPAASSKGKSAAPEQKAAWFQPIIGRAKQ